MASLDDLTGPRRRFFESRRKVFPKAVDGTFRRLKWAIMIVTLAIYYATPWLRWNRGPYAPDQAVLVDLAHRRFYMFAIEIWPHEFYFIAGLLIMAGIGLFLVTSAVGRAWCGYACPQTVWTDLFVHVERAIEGDRNAQFRLERAPWTFSKIGKRVSKHAIWLVIAWLTGGAWIFYFADAPTLARAVFHGHGAAKTLLVGLAASHAEQQATEDDHHLHMRSVFGRRPPIVSCSPSRYECGEHDQESTSLAFVIARITAAARN